MKNILCAQDVDLGHNMDAHEYSKKLEVVMHITEQMGRKSYSRRFNGEKSKTNSKHV